MQQITIIGVFLYTHIFFSRINSQNSHIWDRVRTFSTFLKRFYLFIFREGEGKEKERERNISVWLPLTHLACTPGMCPEWESNWWPFGSQACTQSTEPHHPGPFSVWSVIDKLLFIVIILINSHYSHYSHLLFNPPILQKF